MQTGVIPRALHSKGYGFIKPDEGGEDVFFHVRALVSGDESDLVAGVHVSYDVQDGRKGPQAANVRVLEVVNSISSGEVQAGVLVPWEAGDYREAVKLIVEKHALACASELAEMFGWSQE